MPKPTVNEQTITWTCKDLTIVMAAAQDKDILRITMALTGIEDPRMKDHYGLWNPGRTLRGF